MPSRVIDTFLKAKIEEDDCIGCAKCIKACPYDAILGAPKFMHTVIADECTGCELCVIKCPVDCIQMITVSAPIHDPVKAHQRYQAKLKRSADGKNKPQERVIRPQELQDKKSYIEAAISRVQAKRNKKS